MSERLTKRLANGGVMYDNGEYWAVCYPWNEHCLREIDRMAIKLCDLEDKIEQGYVVEVRRGKWINNHCTVCGMTPIGEETWTSLDLTPPKYELLMSFCPCCGAKMDGERREE